MSAARRHPAVAPTPVTLPTVLEDGIFAGVIGAVLLAGWFLLLDTLNGHPFNTPALLGTLVTQGAAAMATMNGISPQPIAVYTGLHLATFIVVGTIAAYLWAQFEHYPILGFVMLVGFLAFELGFFALDLALGFHLMGRLGAWSVAAGNLLAAAGMFVYLRSRHPHALTGMNKLWADEDE